MKRILVADNDPHVVDSICDMLSSCCLVSSAMTGIEILRMHDRERYDGIIIDVDFGGGVSGLEITEILHKNDIDVKILVFSAIDLPSKVIQQLTEIGAKFCLKPLTKETICNYMEL